MSSNGLTSYLPARIAAERAAIDQLTAEVNEHTTLVQNKQSQILMRMGRIESYKETLEYLEKNADSESTAAEPQD